MALAQIVFEMSCSQDFIMSHRLKRHESKKVHNSGTTCPTKKRKNMGLLIFDPNFICKISHHSPNKLIKFHGPSSNSFRDVLFIRFHYVPKKKKEYGSAYFRS